MEKKYERNGLSTVVNCWIKIKTKTLSKSWKVGKKLS